MWLLLLVVVVVVVVMGIYDIYVDVAVCCCSTRHCKKTTRYQVPEIINHPYHHRHLTSSNSSRSLSLVVVGVAAVVVAVADCGGGSDGHLYVGVALVIVVKNSSWYVRTWYQVNVWGMPPGAL